MAGEGFRLAQEPQMVVYFNGDEFKEVIIILLSISLWICFLCFISNQIKMVQYDAK